ncbi:SURF1 family protein [Jiella sp. M17.18]|uniref:SURF1 family protein n=1 Tax=Jiella sp. M17.18 TaxID=3234247 RepID=UPI0034DEC02C
MTETATPDDEARAEAQTPRSLRSLILLLTAGALFFALFVGLGIWQLERRVWKLNLIASVNARVDAPPIPAPGPSDWPRLTAGNDEYRHVKVHGRFLNDRETFVKAVTDLGGGYWVMTPFVTDRGFTVMVDRGFVPPDLRDPAKRARGEIAGETTVTGLLRMSEPGGAFLHSNVPADDRWYSRDVAAIAKARAVIGPLAPYFIDAERMAAPDVYPVGGLTVISFHNSHLVYAFTWFGMALLTLAAMTYVVVDERRLRQGGKA